MSVLWVMGVLFQQAVAGPVLTWEGRVLDPAGGAYEGVHSLHIALYDGASDASPVWERTWSVPMERGYVRVVLGEAPYPLDASWFADGAVWLGVRVDDAAEGPLRTRLTSVPYALHAQAALSLKGGTVNASSVSVGEVDVISPNGQWVGPRTDFVGPAGVTGPDGLDGAAGEPGARGQSGSPGPTGPQGFRGNTGSNGPTGFQGSTGPRGATGSSGPAGPQYGCVFRRSCGPGQTNYGQAGLIMVNNHYGHCSAVGSRGAAYNDSWTWCHPVLCCGG